MTRIIQSKYKKDLRYGTNIWGRSKSPINKKQRLPGMHGTSTIVKMSNYKSQFSSVQILKTHYNITEKQFRNLFRNSKGNFINYLERRLMSMIYRLGIADTIFAARQLVSHKHILVNDRKVNISSYIVQNGDKIKISERAREFLKFEKHNELSYIEYDEKEKTYSFTRDPLLEEIPFAFKVVVHNITEWYSRLV